MFVKCDICDCRHSSGALCGSVQLISCLCGNRISVTERGRIYQMTRVEIERKRRIQLLLWAYAYEYRDEPLVSDTQFDTEALKVDLSIDTGNAEMDAWFRKHFNPSTGQWVRSLPQSELKKIILLYEKHFRKDNLV